MTLSNKFRFIGLLASLFIISNSFSQPSNVENLQVALGNISYAKVHATVATEFKKLFADAENVTWYNVDKNFLAKFTIDDVTYRVLLTRKGKLVYKITYGKENDLPVEIRKMAKRGYVEFRITAASLVEEADRMIWVINLEDDSNYVIVRVENNEMTENISYKK
jgi:hypothetical protein